MKTKNLFFATPYQEGSTLYIVDRNRLEDFRKKLGHLVKQIEPSFFCKRVNSTKTDWYINCDFIRSGDERKN